MGNTDGNTGALCLTQDQSRRRFEMRMYNQIIVRFEKAVQIVRVDRRRDFGQKRHTVDDAAHRLDLRLVKHLLGYIDQKIKLHLCAVHAAVQMHQQRFRAAAIHGVQHMQHTNRSHSVPHL